jgi:hypothetical protein
LLRSVPAFAGREPNVRRICTLLLDLHTSGLLQPEALRILGSLWAAEDLDEATRWERYDALNWEFVERCSAEGLITDETHLGRIADRLLFPLCGVDLRRYSPKDAKRYREDLDERRRSAACPE